MKHVPLDPDITEQTASREQIWTMRYHCPRCSARPGECCIDVRVHRARKRQDPVFRHAQQHRSAKRPRGPSEAQ